jgi:hypothetical protein
LLRHASNKLTSSQKIQSPGPQITASPPGSVLTCRASSETHEEEDVKNAVIWSFVALAFLAGCEAANIKTSKWEGPPYRLTLGGQPTKPGAVGITLPPIYFTANPEAVQTRANMAMRIDGSIVKNKPAKFTDELLLAPTDISGKQGQISGAYLDMAGKELTKMFNAYCLNGTVKVNVALVKSSIMMGASDVQVDNHRLSDWLPIDVVFKNQHPKC